MLIKGSVITGASGFAIYFLLSRDLEGALVVAGLGLVAGSLLALVNVFRGRRGSSRRATQRSDRDGT
jgi:hypothetical protein